jgi:hypothetical protein
MAITPSQSLDALALDFLKHGATMSVKQMEHKLDAWHNNPATLLGYSTNTPGSRTQMLALGPHHTGESFSSALAGTSPWPACANACDIRRKTWRVIELECYFMGLRRSATKTVVNRGFCPTRPG